MLTLARTTDKLQAFLSGAAATTNPTVTVVFYNLSSKIKEDNSDYPRDRQFTVLAGATEIDILAAPTEQGKIKHIEYINVYNADTSSVTVTVCVDDNATNRILIKATIAPGESLVWEQETGWYVTPESSGRLALGTEVAATSGTSIDFSSLPSWIKRITVLFNEVSTNGTSFLLIQIGDSGGLETSGYVSTGNYTDQAGATAGAASTAGFIVSNGASAASVVSGQIVLCLADSSDNTWIESHSTKISTTQAGFGGGSKALSATLDRLRITTVGGADTFDAGTINILYE